MKPAFGANYTSQNLGDLGVPRRFQVCFVCFETELLTPPQVSLQIASCPNLARLDPTSWSRGMPSRHSPTPRLLLLALELPPVLWLLWPCSVGPQNTEGKQESRPLYIILYYPLIVYMLNHSNTCLIEFNRVSVFVFVYDMFIIDLLEVFDGF